MVNELRATASPNNHSERAGVVVPYAPGAGKNVASTLFTKKKEETPGVDTSFADDRVQLEQRMALAAGGLAAAGLRSVALDTEQLIELLYRSFNLNEQESPIKFTV